MAQYLSPAATNFESWWKGWWRWGGRELGSGDCQKESELDNVGETVWSVGGTSGGWQFNLSRRREGAWGRARRLGGAAFAVVN